MLIATSISTEDSMHLFVEEYDFLQDARDSIVENFLRISEGEVIDGIISVPVIATEEGQKFSDDLDILLWACDELEYA